MDIDNLRVKKLREYLFGVLGEIAYNYGLKSQIGIDFLNDNVSNYSLDKIPVASTVEKWITGTTLYRDVFSFRSRMNFSADVLNNIKNIGFFETFERKIEEKNKAKQLPNIDGIESISCLNCGTFNNGNTDTAEFDIQIEIQYRSVDIEQSL